MLRTLACEHARRSPPHSGPRTVDAQRGVRYPGRAMARTGRQRARRPPRSRRASSSSDRPAASGQTGGGGGCQGGGASREVGAGQTRFPSRATTRPRLSTRSRTGCTTTASAAVRAPTTTRSATAPTVAPWCSSPSARAPPCAPESSSTHQEIGHAWPSSAVRPTGPRGQPASPRGSQPSTIAFLPEVGSADPYADPSIGRPAFNVAAAHRRGHGCSGQEMHLRGARRRQQGGLSPATREVSR